MPSFYRTSDNSVCISAIETKTTLKKSNMNSHLKKKNYRKYYVCIRRPLCTKLHYLGRITVFSKSTLMKSACKSIYS